MANRDIVAIGTSAGGVEALQRIVAGLPADLPAAVLIVIHLSSQPRSGLDAVLARAGRLPARFAADGEPAARGHVYLAPPGCHLLLDGERLRLGRGPRENFCRPSIDPLLRSVALCCGPRSVGAVLTGTLGDGGPGLLALQQCGGIAVVQDPADAAHGEMPRRALDLVAADHVVGLGGMAALLARLVALPAGAPRPVPARIKYEVDVARGGSGSMNTLDRIGRRSVLACPDCHGVMWEIDEGQLVHYRCHVGHAYSAEQMRLALDDNLTRALGSALRALEERIALVQRLYEQAVAAQQRDTAEAWQRTVREYEREAATIRDSIRRFEELSARADRDAGSPDR
jgi:two-component system chemotaxis response regulator CheB